MRSLRFGSAASMTCSSRLASRASCKRRAERRDQLVRQVAHEPDRVGEQREPRIRQLQPAHGRIERREQLIGGVRARAGQAIEQRRLAGVRVADQRDGRNLRALALAARRLALRDDFVEARVQRLDAAGRASGGRFPAAFRRDRAGRCRPSAARGGSSRAPAAWPGACSCASSTCSWPSKLRARCAKMSRISPVRSSTRHLQQRFEIAFLAGRQRVIEQHQIGAGSLARARGSPPPCRCR